MAQPAERAVYDLEQLAADVEAVVTRETSQRAIVEAAEPLLARFLSGRGLSPEYLVPIPKTDVDPRTDFTLYRLHRGSDDCFNIMVAIWPPGGGSGVHDHAGNWVVEGVYEGVLETLRYRRLDSGADPGRADLEEVGRCELRPGDVAHVISPDEAIHDFANPSDESTVSVHIYGGDISVETLHYFDPEAGTCESVTQHIVYDNERS